MSEYARPETLVSTDWVADHREDDGVRLVEVDVDTSAYDTGHVPGAVGFDWQSQLQDSTVRDIPDPGDFEELCSRAGISNDTTVVFYGDNNNWFAAYAFWLFRYYGHDEDELKLMNGGRKKWLAEGRETTTEVPSHPPAEYRAEVDESVRTLREDVLDIVDREIAGSDIHLVDVRSPQEFTGEILAPPGMNETCQRGGHIPGAANIPWATAVNDDGTFKSADELERIYGDQGVDGERPVVAYCRIGERSSHSWYVLRYLLGYDGVTNYDGSWTEYGNLVQVPIER